VNFSFDETQSALRDLARQVFTELATHDRLKELEAGGESFDVELWDALSRSGLLGVGVDEGGFVDQCIILVEQGRAVAPVPLWSHLLASTVVAPDDGEILTVALDEPGADDAFAASMNVKIGVPAVDRAARIIMSTKDSLCVVRTQDVTAERRETTNGQPEYIVTFAGGPGERVAGDALDLARKAIVCQCALGVGVAERALEMTAAYTSERKQFDRPLGGFQAVQQRAADAYIDVEAMRATMWQAAWRLDQGLEADREVAIAKFWAAEGGQRVVSTAQHLHGGMGADIDYPLFRYTLWAKAIELSFGGATRQLARMGEALAR
jgi:alkylation response protein AidB-like acyl-CoA dehydrogenase